MDQTRCATIDTQAVNRSSVPICVIFKWRTSNAKFIAVCSPRYAYSSSVISTLGGQNSEHSFNHGKCCISLVIQLKGFVEQDPREEIAILPLNKIPASGLNDASFKT